MLNSRIRRRRNPGACDMCRKKKIKCDSGERIGRGCTNCKTAGSDCTHNEMTKALGPTKIYVTSLQTRLEKMERILNRLLPGVDLNADLDNLVDAPETHVSPSLASLEHSGPLPRNDEEDDDSISEHMVNKLKKLHLNTDPTENRFFGRSSGFRLVQTAMDLKSQYIGQSFERYRTANASFGSRIRDEFWTVAPWQNGKLDEETKTDPSTIVFPDDDLVPSLVDHYFKEVNIVYPLLHRPTFDRHIAEGLHMKDAIFGNIVLLVCALGAKYSDDPRVFTEGSNTTRSAGHKWFAQVDYCRKSFVLKSTLHELQMIALIVLFSKSSANQQGAWILIGLGLRMAQEIGVHRRRLRKDGRVNVEDELWKRAFWVLLAMDRIVSAASGRPCASHEEDYDQDYPIECDDEYWELPESSQSFHQPSDKPSTMSYFICFLRLMEILGDVMRLVYPSRKTLSTFERAGFKSEQQAITELDSAMNRWMDCVPEHLRWNANCKDKLFLKQSACLYLTYYHVQILIHRPFIPSPRNQSAIAFPSLTICTNAARSCCYIIDALNRSNDLLIPHFLSMAMISTLVLLVNIWDNKRSGVAYNYRRELELIQKIMDMLSRGEQRWTYVGRAKDILVEVCSFSDKGRADQKQGFGQNESPVAAPQMSGRVAGVSYPNGYEQPTIFTTNMCAGGEPITSQSSFTSPVYSNELSRMPVHGQFGHADKCGPGISPSAPGTMLGGTLVPALGPGVVSTVGVGIPSTFQDQDSGNFCTQPMTGQDVPSQDIGQMADIWQMMDMDSMGIWIASANEFEWASYFMSVDQEVNGHV